MGRNVNLKWLMGAGLFLLGSCAVIDKINAPTLEGAPATSALVVVNCEAVMHGMLGLKTPQQVTGGTLRDADGFNPIRGRTVSGLIIFSNVPPGRYYLAKIETTWQAGNTTWQHTYEVPPEKIPSLTVSTTLGEPTFLGVVTVEEIRKPSERGVTFRHNPSKDAELGAWRKFLQLYEGSVWENMIKKRIAELQS
ncbi:MAG: hypothetical protein AABY54_08515 [Deltaproteobacteria bacterium]